MVRSSGRLSIMLLALVVWCAGCGEPAPSEATEPASPRPALTGTGDIRQAGFETSPPTHPSMSWADLAPRIESARELLRGLPDLQRPQPITRPLAERATAEQLASIAQAHERATVLRAEAARHVAAGRPDAAVDELAMLLGVSRELASWGVPAAAEASAGVTAMALDALDQPRAAPLKGALSSDARNRLANALEGLDRIDPAGRMRAMVEASSSRSEAVASLAQGADGPSALRSTAARYRPGAERGSAEQIDRLLAEAGAFAMSLADGWDRPSRSAITERLRQRQAEDTLGMLNLVFGDTADACDADAMLRDRITESIGSLR